MSITIKPIKAARIKEKTPPKKAKRANAKKDVKTKTKSHLVA